MYVYIFVVHVTFICVKKHLILKKLQIFLSKDERLSWGRYRWRTKESGRGFNELVSGLGYYPRKIVGE